MRTISFFIAIAFFSLSTFGQDAEEIIENYYQQTVAKELLNKKIVVKRSAVNLGIVKSTSYEIYNLETGDYKIISYTKSLGKLTKEIKLYSNSMAFKFNHQDYVWERMSEVQEKAIQGSADYVILIPQKTTVNYDIIYDGKEKGQYKIRYQKKGNADAKTYYFDEETNYLNKIHYVSTYYNETTGASEEKEHTETIKAYGKFGSFYQPSEIKAMGIKVEITDYWLDVELPESFFEPDEMTAYGGDIDEKELLKVLKTGKHLK